MLFVVFFFFLDRFLHCNLLHDSNGRRGSVCIMSAHSCKGKYSLKETESFLAKSKGEIKTNLKLKAWQHVPEKQEVEE